MQLLNPITIWYITDPLPQSEISNNCTRTRDCDERTVLTEKSKEPEHTPYGTFIFM